MRALRILNTKERESLLIALSLKYGIDAKQFNGRVFLEDKDEVWVSSRGCLDANMVGFNVDSVGMLFARKKQQLELTVNAVQLFFSGAGKDAITLGREEAVGFINGSGLKVEKGNGLYIVKHMGSVIDLGCVEEGILKRNSGKQNP
ncbi:MAG: hypothetical protein V1703_00645 [Candidatus Altiarchaeota archaeon]